MDEHRIANSRPLDPGFDSFLWTQQRVKVGRILRVLEGLGTAGRLADVGCSSGILTERYRAAPGVAELHGLDFNPDALARAADRGIITHCWNMDAEPCPLPDGHFDTIIAADVIEHLVNTDRFVAELRRLLRPQGHLIVTTPNLAYWWSRARLLLGRLPWLYPGASATVRIDGNQALDHIRIHTAASWEALFAHHGLARIAVQGYPPSPPEHPSAKERVFSACDRVLARTASLSYGLLFVLGRG